MRLTRSSFTFSPFITTCAVVLATVMISASIWQWQRYLYKLELQERYSAHSQEPALKPNLSSIEGAPRSFLNDKIAVEGTYDLTRQMIVINRSNGREPGFWLLTPFRLHNSEHALLVSRGFIPFAADSPSAWERFSFPPLQQRMTITVVVQDGVPRRNWFAPVNPPSERDKEFKERWAYVDVERIAAQLPYPVVRGVFGQELTPLNDGSYPQKAIHIGVPPSTHFWYSIEWVLLAMSTVAGALALQLFPKRRPRPERSLNFTQAILLVTALAATAGIQLPSLAQATSNPSEVLEKAQVVERLGSTVDLSLVFTDATGKQVNLGELSPKGRPLILAPVYYECPELCGLTQTGIARLLNELTLKLGEDFSVVSISFDPAETPAFAAAKAEKYRELLTAVPEAQRQSWHFLVGSPENTKTLTDQIGFYYAPDGKDFMHAAVLAVLTPKGVISRYLYGIRFPAKDVELALVEASEGKVGSLVQRALMFCFRYDHIQGRYTLAIMQIIRVVCIGFFFLLLACLLWLRVKERGRPSNE